MLNFIYFFLFLIINFNNLYAEVLYVWSQIIPENKLSIRAITDDYVCPTAHVDGKEVMMSTRSISNNIEMICELIVEKGVRDIHISGMQVPTLPKKFNKIAFIGDTGCRINAFYQQECNSKESWPLKKNLDAIASHRPDLIIHVGDYHYRKSKCRHKKKCGSIYGYDTEAWYADWFDPAKDVMLKSPFLFVRGNHENCNNAHKGWFQYFDPYPFLPEKCEDFVQSWSLDIGLMKFFVFDSSFGKDIYTSKDEINALKTQFSRLIDGNSKKPIWFLTHKPLWRASKKTLFALKKYGNFAQIKAFGNRFPNNVTAVVSGHIHIAQVLLMNEAPDQIIVGNGGALLHAQDQDPTYKDVEFHYSKSKHYIAHKIKNVFGFGFAILDLNKHTFTFYNQDNDQVYSMQLNKDFKIIRET